MVRILTGTSSGGEGGDSVDTALLKEGDTVKWDNTTKKLVSGQAVVEASTGEWNFDESIRVPQASVKLSDTLSVSEATSTVFIRNFVEDTNSILVSSTIDEHGSHALEFIGAASKETVVAQPDTGTEHTANPLVVPILATLSNQTDAVTVMTGAAMTNVRMTITDDNTGVIVKYIPNRRAVVDGVGGLDFRLGTNRVDFNNRGTNDPINGLFYLGHTPMRQKAGQASTLTIFADSVSILGEPSGIPFFQNEIQFLHTLVVPFIKDITNVADNYMRLNNEQISPTGGLVVTYNATGLSDTTTDGQFTEGEAGVSNPTVVTDGTATFAQDDFVEINSEHFNSGLYEVESHIGTLLTLRGVGTVDTVEDFTSRDLITTHNSTTIIKVELSALRCNTSGDWEQGKGSTTPLVYRVIDLFGSDYQFETSEAESSNISIVFDNKVTLTTPTLPAGNYRFEFSGEITNSLANQSCGYEFTIDAGTVAEGEYSTAFGGNYQSTGSFKSNVALAAGIHTAEINFNLPSGAGSALIRRARIEVFRVN